MTDHELRAAFGELRTLCTSIIGFHVMTEREEERPQPIHLMEYQAQVYAGGLALTFKVHQIADELESRA